MHLKGAQIVNGAQTSKSILDKKKKASNLDAEDTVDTQADLKMVERLMSIEIN